MGHKAIKGETAYIINENENVKLGEGNFARVYKV